MARSTIAHGLFPDATRVARGAVLSDCGRYRYLLWREWSAHLTSVGFLMLNPSTADAERDDPTIRRCIGFAQRWGFGAVDVVNLYAWRSTKPSALLEVEDAVSEPGEPYRNFGFIADTFKRSAFVVAAWGGPAVRLGVNLTMLATIKERWPAKLRVLGFNQDGSPMHPLFVPYETKPVMVVQ